MKAILVSEFGDEDVLRCTEVPDPVPAENEVRVRLFAVGVNPVEAYVRAGKYARLPSLPYTPGTDGAGIIDMVGQGCEGLARGDRVFVAASLAARNTGTYAEYVVCDAAAVRPLPPVLPYAQGAGLGIPGLTAAFALFSRARAVPGETVLVHGASGGVGTLAIQLARRVGCTVYGTAGSAEGEELARELGAHQTFNHHEDGYEEKIVAATGGRGPDVIVEMLANVNLARDLSIIAEHGRIAVVGSRGSLEFAPRDVMGKNADILGVLSGSMSHADFRLAMARLSAALENGPANSG